MTGLTKTLLQSGPLLHLHKQKHNRVFPKSSFKKSHKYLNLGCWYSSLLHKPWHFWTLGTICISYCYLSFSNGRFHLFLTFWPFSHHIQFIKWPFPPADRCCVRIWNRFLAGTAWLWLLAVTSQWGDNCHSCVLWHWAIPLKIKAPAKILTEGISF